VLTWKRRTWLVGVKMREVFFISKVKWLEHDITVYKKRKPGKKHINLMNICSKHTIMIKDFVWFLMCK
jgi:hypothetical protein